MVMENIFLGITALYNQHFYKINNSSDLLYEIAASWIFFSDEIHKNYLVASIMPLYRKCFNKKICLGLGFWCWLYN